MWSGTLSFDDSTAGISWLSTRSSSCWAAEAWSFRLGSAAGPEVRMVAITVGSANIGATR